MSDKTYVLSLSADTFNAFKMDFDSALQRLLQKMDRLQSDSASINCKISVALTPAPERNFDAAPEPTNDDFRPLPDDDDIPF